MKAINNIKRNNLSWLVCESRCVLDGASVDALLWVEVADEHDAEVLVRRATEAAQVLVVG